MSGPPLSWTRSLAAPPERVFAALTDALHLSHWFCDEAECEPREGGVLVLRWRPPGGSPEPFVARWRDWDPPASASFTGGHAGYPGGSAGTVRYTLAASEQGGTRLVVAHEPPAGPEHDAFVAGWRAAWPRALDRLERYLTPGAVGAGG